MQPVLLWDGDCGFCAHWVRRMQTRGARVEFRPCQDAAGIRAAWNVADEECKQTAVWIDEAGPRRGAAAVNAVLRTLPGLRNAPARALARLYPVPGIRQAEEAGYRWVARNRHRFRPRRRQ